MSSPEMQFRLFNGALIIDAFCWPHEQITPAMIAKDAAKIKAKLRPLAEKLVTPPSDVASAEDKADAAVVEAQAAVAAAGDDPHLLLQAKKKLTEATELRDIVRQKAAANRVKDREALERQNEPTVTELRKVFDAELADAEAALRKAIAGPLAKWGALQELANAFTFANAATIKSRITGAN